MMFSVAIVIIKQVGNLTQNVMFIWKEKRRLEKNWQEESGYSENLLLWQPWIAFHFFLGTDTLSFQ